MTVESHGFGEAQQLGNVDVKRAHPRGGLYTWARKFHVVVIALLLSFVLPGAAIGQPSGDETRLLALGHEATKFGEGTLKGGEPLAQVLVDVGGHVFDSGVNVQKLSEYSISKNDSSGGTPTQSVDLQSKNVAQNAAQQDAKNPGEVGEKAGDTFRHFWWLSLLSFLICFAVGLIVGVVGSGGLQPYTPRSGS